MRGFDQVAIHFWVCGPWKPVLFRIPAEVSTCDGEGRLKGAACGSGSTWSGPSQHPPPLCFSGKSRGLNSGEGRAGALTAQTVREREKRDE